MQTALEYYESGTADARINAIRGWLTVLPDKPVPAGESDDYKLWSCHGIVRAVKQRFALSDWEVNDGYFIRQGQEHCWLSRRLIRGTLFVLDVYPVAAMGGPLLVDASSYGSPWCSAYWTDSEAFNERREIFEKEAALALSMTVAA